jgi:hypothetical protein
VPGDDLAVAVDQDRNVKAKALDAVGDLPDLLLRMMPRVGGIRLQLRDPAVDDVEGRTGL